MRIAILSTPSVALPPIGYAGVERVVSSLEAGLVKKNHDVTVFATGDSTVHGHLAYYYEKALQPSKRLTYNAYFFLQNIYSFVQYLKENRFDIIHLNDAGRYALYFSEQFHTPFVTTLHGSYRTTTADAYNIVEQKRNQLLNFKHFNYVSISNFQRTGLPDLNYVSTVYNGIDLGDFTFVEQPSDDYISWLGRVTDAKGLDTAIIASIQTQKVFRSHGFVDEGEHEYYQTKIAPYVDNKQVFFNGETESREQKTEFLSNSKVLLFPIRWDEPFGIVLIEAMATGTPVVAFAKGSIPEVIKDGVTGFIVNPSDEDIRGEWIIKKTGMAGLCEAIERIYSLPNERYREMRKACRAHIEQNFTVEKMVDGYEKVYQEILAKKA